MKNSAVKLQATKDTNRKESQGKEEEEGVGRERERELWH